MTWNCHMDDYAKGRYAIILRIDLLTYLALNLKFSYNDIEVYGGTFKESTATIFDLGTYEFEYLNKGNIIPKEPFINSYS